MWLILHVALHVQCEMVGPGEGTLAEVTLKGSMSGVLSEMAGQLVRAGELPTATFPTAVIRLLTWESTSYNI